jgi:TonB-dependent receptor
MQLKYLFLGLLAMILLFPAAVRAQSPMPTGIAGSLTDGKQPLAGATITVLETKKSTISGSKGEFSLPLPPGSYTVEIRYVGLKTINRKITVGPSQVIHLPLTMSVESKMMATASVQATRRATTVRALLENRRASTNIEDAIGAIQIEKSASINTAQALQRVTGVTVKDGKYITVRGLSDRNVVVQLNGSRMASADASRSSVAVDLIPAQLLDNITVEKSITADKPGDANGAVVEIHTKAVPDSRFLLIGAQTGFNGNIGVFGNANSFPDANMGFFGQNVKKQGLTKDYLALEQDYSARGYSIPQGMFGQGLQSSIGAALTDQTHYNEALRINRIMEQGFSPYLTTTPSKYPLDQIYDLTYGNRYPLKGGKVVGLVLGVNYYNRSQSNPTGQNNFYTVTEPPSTGYNSPNITAPNEVKLLPVYKLNENTGNRQLNYGGLATLSFRFNPFNEMSFTYNGNFGTETNATQEDGVSNPNLLIAAPGVVPVFRDHQHIYDFVLRSTQRTLNSFQLRGDHKFRFVKKWLPWQLSYSGSRSNARQDDPDYRDTRMRVDSLGRIVNPLLNQQANAPQYISSGYDNTYYAESNRYYRTLAEQNSNYKADLIIPFKIPHQAESIIKAGGYYYGRRRNYNETLFTRSDSAAATLNDYGGYVQAPGSLTALGGNLTAWAGPGQVGIVENNNIAEGQAPTAGYLYSPQAGTSMIGNTLFINSYHAKEDITAFYAMTDLNLTKDWRVIGGLRIENTSFQATEDTANSNFSNLTGIVDKQEFIRNYTTNYLAYNWLPSGSVVYKGVKNVNFRVAYSKTLIRPELNEIVLSAQRDPIQQLTVYGNKDLKNGVFSNYDFRTDWFIGTEELVSASVFYKTVVNQLERVYTSETVDNFGFQNSFVTFRNNPTQGKAYGLEFEVRKNLAFAFPFGKYLFLGSNVLVAHSKTTIDSAEYFILSRLDRNASHTRPLVDQPNFALNANIDFEQPKWGSQVSVLFNLTGKRLSDINADGSPNIYEFPASSLDVVISQKITKRLVFKAFAKNILNSTTYYRYTNAGNTKTFGVDNQQYIRRAFNYGSVFTFGFKYTL